MSVEKWRFKVSEWQALYTKLHGLTLATINSAPNKSQEQNDKDYSVLYLPWHSAINWGKRLAQDDVAALPAVAGDLQQLGARIDSAVLFANAMEPHYMKVKFDYASWWPTMRDYYEDLIMGAGEYIGGRPNESGSQLGNDLSKVWDEITKKAKEVMDMYGLPVLVIGGLAIYMVFRK